MVEDCGLSCGLDDYYTEDEIIEGFSGVCEKWKDYIPKDKLILGLDISKNSSGVTIFDSGERFTYNISLDPDISSKRFSEVLYRRDLSKKLEFIIGGKDFDLILIEDAFVGENASTARLLFALNTAIDELILDNRCSTVDFVRVPNTVWKSWLNGINCGMDDKGLNDKEKIRIRLESIGIFESGEGYQDRLDSTGLCIGYYLGGKEDLENRLKIKDSVKFSDMEFDYASDSSFLFYGSPWVGDPENVIVFDTGKSLTKDTVIGLLSESPGSLFVSRDPVQLGYLSRVLGVESIPDGGYLGFRVKKSKYKKYVGV